MPRSSLRSFGGDLTAAGVEAIARQLSDDVWVVAPETNQSGAAHSLTLTRPLRAAL